MKKTVFVGRVNDQEFDNVKDYNACVQAMMDMGQDFQATSSTQVVDVPEDDCECTCSGKDECCKCNHTEKPLKAVTAFLPAYEVRNNGVYIDEIVGVETDDEFNDLMDKLDSKLQSVYDAVVEAIPHNNENQIATYKRSVDEMIEVLANDLNRNEKAHEPILTRINELEEELENLYAASNKLDRACDVITTYQGFYNAVAAELNDDDCDVEENNENEYQEAAARLTNGFQSLLEEIFGRR